MGRKLWWLTEKMLIESEHIKKVFRLKPYQKEFVLSDARYPALVSGWSTGKTLCGILKMLRACTSQAGNVFYCIRKEWEDLKDSTVKDFERYTGITVPTSRDVVLDNGSIIMFRHMEEIRNLQNINLGGVWIEQAEELDSAEQFEMLMGRIRLAHVKQFMMLTANTNGHDWIYKLWKSAPKKDFHLIEATTFDNEENCSRQWLASLENLKTMSPARYRRFVLNSWEETGDSDAIIQPAWILKAVERIISVESPIKRIVGIDVARGGSDKTVMYALENGRVMDRLVLERKDTMEVVGHATLFAERNKKIRNFAVDETPVDVGVLDRLKELGYNVVGIGSGSGSSDPARFRNVRAEVWAYGAAQFESGTIALPAGDTELKEQLGWARWKPVSSGILQVESKDEIRKRYGASTDYADAYLYGLFGMRKIRHEYAETPYSGESQKNVNGWIQGAYVPLPPSYGVPVRV